MWEDPAPVADFASQSREAKRQRAMAEMLRQRALQDGQKGQMVGRHYVQPHFLSNLVPIVSAALSNYTGKKADKAEEDFSVQTTAAANKWAAGLPKAVAGVKGRPELQGPRDLSGSPELDAVEDQPPQMPDRGTILKHTLAGLKIPGNEVAAQMWAKGMQDELTREDAQAARREDLQARLTNQKEIEADRIQQRMREVEAQMKTAQMTVEQRAEAARMMDQWRKDHDKLLLEIAKIRAAASKKGGGDDLKTLPAAQSKAWMENGSAMKQIQKTLLEVTGNKGAFGIKNVAPDVLIQRLDPKGVKARAMVADIGSLKIHDRSGAAVSAMEFPRLRPFVPDVQRDTPETIITKLQSFYEQYEQMQQEILDLAESQNWRSPALRRNMEGPTLAPSAGMPTGEAEVTRVINGVTYVKRADGWYEK